MSLLKADPNEVMRSREFWSFIAGAACANPEIREKLAGCDPSNCTIDSWRPMIDALRVGNGKSIWSILHEKWGLSREQAPTTAEAAIEAAKEFKVRHTVRREMVKLLSDDNWAWDELDTMGRSLLDVAKLIINRNTDVRFDGDTVQAAPEVATVQGKRLPETTQDH